ncbi:PRD domain-containing protein [Lactonifactor sp. BIOML-A3]|uniref:BglG family transcription antiterminator n=1 Tax=unclassified Lactonifactor TaxID=2636670 RepID=UPI0012AF4DF7|nr:MULTISPECIES: transcription antiterminator [unclassified Lactonifactor]MSA03657.1 PRD domain-containing protein [Lactonifactor sp. BIOML-A5]MSA07605.1 PRD domain-containing protein [Lactonifactor sp. BIOML-A4]MSA14664.1 PRD domain-containing protein [Lactonifactor sp. BIOML-A3]MSA19086.1 PRD domain-containing protein [Lactonifactor sp. BIOML-A2]MSA37509.1 PRD domain-containing protein [Lactonifactor sp. BIOML-A1]
MENLNKRQLEFVRLLLEEKEYRSIQYFAQKLEVSDKTLQEDLKTIRGELKLYGAGILAKTGKGILADEGIRHNMDLLNHLHAGNQPRKWNSSERRNNILKNLLLHSGTATSVQKLSDSYYVGKASIVNDLKYVEEWIAPYHLSLVKNKKGTQIAGREKDIREAITAVIHLDEVTLQNLLEIFQPEEIAFVEALLEDLKLDTSDIYYKNLLTHILICIQRVRSGRKVRTAQRETVFSAKAARQYQRAENISAKIKERYGINIGEDETFYIYQYISSLGTVDETPGWVGESDSKSDEVAAVLTEYMTDILDMEVRNEDMLLQGLMMHIRPLLNRLEYNIKIANPLLEEMQMSYPQMVGICQIVCGMICERYGLKEISLDEIANIATYYQTLMVKQTSLVNVLVVCHSGYGTSQLLSARLQQEFPNFNILDVIPSRKLSSFDLKQADLVISTVPVDVAAVPYLVVSSFLTNRDISAIRNNVYLLEQRVKINYGLLESLLPGGHITFGNWNGARERGRKICEAYLLPQCLAVVWKGRKDKTEVFLTIDRDNKMLRLDLLPGKAEEQKELFRELYRLSLEEVNLRTLIQCRSQEEVQKYLRQGVCKK